MIDELETAIGAIDAKVTDARSGLPEPLFYLVSRLTPMVNVDLMIRDDHDRVLLTWRADPFYGPGWHIPGGIIRFKERWEDRITAVARHELGAEVTFAADPIDVKQPINPTRANRGHFISLLFDCRLAAPPDPARRAVSQPPENGQWAWHEGCPADLIPVHQRLYGDRLAGLGGAGE